MILLVKSFFYLLFRDGPVRHRFFLGMRKGTITSLLPNSPSFGIYGESFTKVCRSNETGVPFGRTGIDIAIHTIIDFLLWYPHKGKFPPS
jgi:hypothetical protein